MSSNSFSCSFGGCSQSFRTAERFLLHSRRHINFDFKGESDFESVLAHSQGVYYCSACSFDSRSSILFGEHLRQHIFSLPYVCGHCDTGLRKIHDLKLHFQNNHPKQRTTFKFHKNEKVLDLFLQIMQHDNENIYFLNGINGQIVFMKADTSFWFVMLFTSSERHDVNDIFMSKNMSGIVDKCILTEFPGGHTTQEKEICVPVDIKTNIDDSASMILNSLEGRADLKNIRQIGQYKFAGSDFQCLSCNFTTSKADVFGDHIWNEIHIGDVGCFHRKVKSCVLDGQHICALIESTLYCLMQVKTNKVKESSSDLNERAPLDATNTTIKVVSDVNISEKTIACTPDGTNNPSHKSKSGNKRSCSSKEKNPKKLCKDKEPIESNKCDLPHNQVHESDLKLQDSQNDAQTVVKKDVKMKKKSKSVSLEEKTFSMFPFGLYLKQCSKDERVELVHDVSPFSYVCKRCDFSCNSLKLYKFHKEGCRKISSMSPEYTCPRCFISCWSMRSLLEHVQFHLGLTTLNIHTCYYCGKIYTNSNFAKNHLEEKHSIERSIDGNGLTQSCKNFLFLQNIVKCFVCGSGHSWPSKLIGHLRSKHKMSRLATYLSGSFASTGDIVPTITFPKELLFCKDESELEPDPSSDMSFDCRVKMDLNILSKKKGEKEIEIPLESEGKKSTDPRLKRQLTESKKASSK